MLGSWMAPIAQLPPSEAPGLLELFAQAGVAAKLILLLLAVISVASWAIMIGKYLQFRRVDRHTRSFLAAFRRSKRFSEVNAVVDRCYGSPLVALFQAGYVEIDGQVKSAAGAEAGGYRIRSLEGVERSLRRAAGQELLALGRGTGFLATAAAASPFIGLFGTVWGIMVAFQQIGVTGSTSLVAVAPGIAEALVNTAAGLAAAIPALMGYNLFGSRLRRARAEMEDFVLEFVNLAERNFT